MPRILWRVLSVVALCLVFGVGLAWADHGSPTGQSGREVGDDLSASWKAETYVRGAEDIVLGYNAAKSDMYQGFKPLSQRFLESRSKALCTIVADHFKENGATGRSVDWATAKTLLAETENTQTTSDFDPRVFRRLQALSKTSKAPVAAGAKGALEPFDITHVAFAQWEPDTMSYVDSGVNCTTALLNQVYPRSGQTPTCVRKDLKTAPLPSPTPGEPKCPAGSASLSEILAGAERETKDEQVRTCIEAQDGKCRMMVVRTEKAEPELPKEGELNAPVLSNGWKPVRGKDGVYLRGIARQGEKPGRIGYLACVPPQYLGSLPGGSTPDRATWASGQPVKCTQSGYVPKYLPVVFGKDGRLHTVWPPNSGKLAPLTQHASVERDLANHYTAFTPAGANEKTWANIWLQAYKGRQASTQPTTAVATNATTTATAATNAAASAQKIQPATLASCTGCHTGESDGPTIVDLSKARERVLRSGQGRMPPENQMSEAERKALAQALGG